MADTNFDVLIIGSGPGGYVTAIRAAQLGFKTAIVERDYLGGICLNWGCIPTKALLRSAEIFHYMQHAKDYGLKADNVGYDPAAVVKRSRAVSKRLNDGVGFLMKKNKVTVIWGEAVIDAPGKVTVKAVEERSAQGRAGRGRLSSQTHHHRHRRAAARAARLGARQETGLDLFRGHGAAVNSEIAAGDRLRRHRHRVRLVLPHARRRGDRGRSAAADFAGRGPRDSGVCAQEFREAGHQDLDQRQGDQARQEIRQRHRDHRRERQDANDHRRARDLRRRRRRQYRKPRAGKARREDRARLRRGRRLQQDQRAGHLRHRRRLGPADARAQGRARGRRLRRGHQGPQSAPDEQAA